VRREPGGTRCKRSPRTPQVTADVGGKLNIASLQDTSTFDAEQKSAGFTLSLCVSPFCYGASNAVIQIEGLAT
jgi:hypothetical protein